MKFNSIDEVQKANISSSNLWILGIEDYDTLIDNIHTNFLNSPPTAFISFPSAKSKKTKHELYQTAEIISFVSYDMFSSWVDIPHYKRKKNPEYQKLKGKHIIGNKNYYHCSKLNFHIYKIK